MRLILVFIFCPVLALCQSVETVVQKGHELAVVAVAISLDSNYVATGSKDKSAKLWEVSTGREVRTFLGHEATVTSLEFTADGKMLITGSNDKSIRFWEVSTGKELYSIQTNDIVTDLAIDPNLHFFVVAGYGNSGYGDSVTVYDLSSKKIIEKISASPDKGLGSGVDVAISSNGKWVALGEDNRTINLYNTSDWTLIKTFQPEEGWCGGCGTRVGFSSDNRILYAASHNGPVRKYDLDSFKLIKTYEEKTDDLTGLAISSDGKRIARSTEKEMRVWDALSGDSLATIHAKDQGEFHEIAFTSNNKAILITSDDNTVNAWNFIQGKNETTFTGYLNKRDRGGLPCCLT